MDGQGRVSISVLGTHSVYMLDSAFLNPPVQVVTGLSRPADICYNMANDTLGVPNSGNNTVNFYNMGYILGLTEKPSLSNDFLKTSADDNGVLLEWMLENQSQASLQLFSLNGSIISCEDVMPSGKILIENGRLRTGIYFARIVAGEKQVTEKFFID